MTSDKIKTTMTMYYSPYYSLSTGSDGSERLVSLEYCERGVPHFHRVELGRVFIHGDAVPGLILWASTYAAMRDSGGRGSVSHLAGNTGLYLEVDERKLNM